ITSEKINLPSKAACVEEIGEPQDPRFFQLLGLFLSDANGDLSALRLEQCLNDAAQVDDFARYVAENWGERRYADDYVNRAMVDGMEGDDAGNTITATLTNRRIIGRLQAFVRRED